MDKQSLFLYAITDSGCIGERDFDREIENALQGGVTILQLREKGLTTQELTEKAIRLKGICEKFHVPLIVNDDVEAALRSGADGVHVGAEDMSVARIRELAGKDFIIGATAKTLEQARNAQEQGADYLGCGALFTSPTKKDARPMTPKVLQTITASVDIPVVAIGGLTFDNIGILKNSGVSGAAVVSAVFAEDDVKAAAARLKERLRDVLS